MPNPDLERLRGIKTFPSLVKYLRDDLDWPIESDDFDDLTFDFEPEELGIDPKTSAKIESIKQLRPLASNQPWGIFFVKFEPKKLPVVALRRILGQLVIKKRASANRADQQTWRLSDLLFLSNYGEDEQRQITFAHFSGNDDSKSLPTLKVLGWDDSDTPLHIDHVHTTLRDKLRWPGGDPDLDIWRGNWSSAFTLRYREVIDTSKKLAVKLAGLAQKIRKRANSILSIEVDSGPLRKLMAGFKEALIHDLTEDSFADMYAQTIAYGLLSARITNPKGNNPDELSNQMPITNPFLQELMESFLSVGGRKGKPETGTGSGIDFDELGINEVVDLLDNSNMEAVIRDFGDKNPLEDPVIHFYESFLHEYDSKTRMQRGVFYTPRPVVSFIVRSVDENLRTKFGLEDGLADTTTWNDLVKRNKGLKIPNGAKPDDPFVQILDPATGTGTFLVEVIDLIHKTMSGKWKDEGSSEREIKQLWNDYVPKHLLPRLYGYELLMAPYTIAHMKIGLKLHETGFLFNSDERTRIYLTNALEPAQDFSDRFAFAIPALAHEANAVNKIKLNKPFTVVIGNPPYAGLSANLTKFTDDMLKQTLPTPNKAQGFYTLDGEGLGEKKLWLQDDYVKFLRLGQWQIELTGAGILSFITNHGYLDNPTFRGMRQSLLSTFDNIFICDLHGNSKKKEKTPEGEKDVNVFDIQQGVAIALFLRTIEVSGNLVRHSDIYGIRDHKNSILTNTTALTSPCINISPQSPYYFLSRWDKTGYQEFENFTSILHVMPKNVTGIVTARDSIVISDRKETIKNIIEDFRDEKLTETDIREKYFPGKKAGKYKPGDSRGWKLSEARELLMKDLEWNNHYKKVLYRPFDLQYIYYVPWMVDWPRREVMPQMIDGDNFGLSVGRQGQVIGSEMWDIALCTRHMTEFNMYRRGGNNLFPLYLYPSKENKTINMEFDWPKGEKGRIPNLSKSFIELVEQSLKMSLGLSE